LYSGMADVAALTDDENLLHAVDKIWQNTVDKKLYVQGGIGAIASGERFGNNYELPNATAYNETCAAIANVYWNYRMFLLHGDAKYIDVLEKSLYNNLMSGIGLDGKSFFYSNAMQIKHAFSHGAMEPARAGWFECSCCPTNMVRLLPSIPGYTYAQKENDVFVNLFMSSNTTLTIHNKPVSIIQENNYPWSGDLKFTITPKSTDNFALRIRIPGWVQSKVIPSDLYSFAKTSANHVVIKVNGKPLEYKIENGYAIINKNWKKSDVVEVNLPMEVKSIVANDKVADDRGKVALQRGPLVYCAEGIDNDGKASNIIIPSEAVFETEERDNLLNGVTVVRTKVPVVEISNDGKNISTVEKTVTAIPYYAWANRGKGEMIIWFPTRIKGVDLVTAEAGQTPVGK